MTYALEIADLKKTYPGGTEALKGISLSVQEGDFYALLGPNGAGKSSTIGIIGSLVTKSSGKVKIFGIDVDTNIAEAKTLLGVVSQEINFSQFEKVLDIVVTQAGFYGIPKSEAMPKVENILKRLSLWDKRNDQARTLSGGYKRRLMIAKALVHDPKLLILDEPTAGVDIELRREMWTFLKEINTNGTTIILTTHYLEEAEQLCRNIGIIDHGTMVADTGMKDLLGTLNVQGFVFDLTEPLDKVPSIEGFPLKLEDPLTLVAAVNKDRSINALFAELSKLWTLTVKEIRRFLRIWVQTLVPPAVTMSLYFVIFGSLIGPRIGSMDGFDYIQYMIPGLIMLSVITNSYNNVVSSFYSVKFQKSIEELLISPMPNWAILLGFVLGGVARGVLIGFIVFGVSLIFYPEFTVVNPLLTVTVLLLTAILFSLMGFINAVFADSFDDISIIPTFILTPLIYLGGVFYSINILPDIWRSISMFNPMLYVVNTFREGMLGVSDVSISFSLGMIFAFIGILAGACLYFLKKGTGIRQ